MNMFHKGMLLKFLCICVFGSALLAWGITEYMVGTKNAASGETGGDGKLVAVAKEEPEKPEPTTYILAKDDFSNLQSEDVKKPVYDRYTLAQRRAKGLPTQFPGIVPYTKEKVAYLTFDDGPDNKNTPAILDILKNYGVPATFYVVGTMVEENPEVLKRIFEEGHAIGNHTYSHDYNYLYASPDNFLADIMRTRFGVKDVVISYVGPVIGAHSGPGTVALFFLGMER